MHGIEAVIGEILSERPIDMTLRRGFDNQMKQLDQTVGRNAMLGATEKMLDRLRTQRDKFTIVTVDSDKECESDLGDKS